MSNIMKDLKTMLTRLGVTTIEAGVYTDEDLPDCYIVISPTGDKFEPAGDTYYVATEQARLYIYRRGSITTSVYEFKDSVVTALMADGYAVSDSRYDGFNSDTHYHCWSVAAAGAYPIYFNNTEE